jgi:CheY-like chemotaxis protein
MSRLLIVDDDPVVLDVLRQLLAQPGREIALAADAEEAIALAAKVAPDVALIDKNLPGLSGLELSRKLKQAHPEIEIIVTTGYASLETAIEAVRLGAFDYLTKPIHDYSDFSLRVQGAIDRGALRRSQRDLLERLMESEVRHRRLIEAMPDALVVHDAQTGQVQDANAAAARLYGYSPDELVRLQADALGPIGAGRQLHRRKDGATFWADVSTTEYNQGSQLLRVMSVRAIAGGPCSCGRDRA